MDDQYFSRTATWSRLGEQIVVHDSFSPLAPRMITMEPWHQVAFLAADGEHKVREFIEHMGSEYPGGPPVGLREQIHSILDVLITEGIMCLHDQPQALPPYIAEEYHSQPPDVRKAQMEADGRIGPRPNPAR